MRQVRYRSLIAVISVAQGLLATGAGAQQSDIEISYVEVQNAVSPKPGIFRVPRTTQVRVAGDNTLAVKGRSRYGAGGVQTTSEQVRAGEDVRSGMTTSRWRVGGPNVLIRERTFPSHVVRTRIRVTGDACQATVTFHLKKGATQYQMPWAPTGEAAFFRAIHAENVTCKITGG
jgi:hypothetical protein